MALVRPVGWVVAVALLTAGCSDDSPAPKPPAPQAAPASTPVPAVAAVPRPQPAAPAPAPIAPGNPPAGQGWTYPPKPLNPAFPTGLPAVPGVGMKPQVPGSPPLPGGTQTQPPMPTPKPVTPTLPTSPQPPVPGVPPAPPGAAPPTTTTPPGAMTPKTDPKKDPKKDDPKKAEWPKSVNGKSIGEWIDDFKNPDPAIRDAAVKVMPLFGPDARDIAAKDIIRLIEDPDPGIRINAMLILGTLGCESKEQLRAAARAMVNAVAPTAPGSMIRVHAARTLAAMGPDGSDAIGTMVRIANDPSWETRQAVAAALGRIGAPVYEDKPPPPGAYIPPKLKRPASKLAMDRLVYDMLKDESAAVRMEAMQSIIVLGPPHTDNPATYIKLISPYLKTLAIRHKTEKDDTVRIWLYVVEMMYDDRSIDRNMEKVAEFLTSEDINLKVQALGALAVLGPLAKPLLGEMIVAVNDPDESVVIAALTSIVSLGDGAKYALGDLEKIKAATTDKDRVKLLEQVIKTIKAPKPEPAPEPKKDEKKKKK